MINVNAVINNKAVQAIVSEETTVEQFLTENDVEFVNGLFVKVGVNHITDYTKTFGDLGCEGTVRVYAAVKLDNASEMVNIQGVINNKAVSGIVSGDTTVAEFLEENDVEFVDGLFVKVGVTHVTDYSKTFAELGCAGTTRVYAAVKLDNAI